MTVSQLNDDIRKKANVIREKLLKDQIIKMRSRKNSGPSDEANRA